MLVCGAVTFTILLVSGNTMAMSVRERIKEVGVLKTLGFNNDAILGMIVGEAVCIALIGGAIGLVLSSLLMLGAGAALGSFIPQFHDLSVTPFTALMALGLSFVVGVVSSFIPAWNAAKTNILDSLRYAG
jgi:putative ABC transport system permease protein